MISVRKGAERHHENLGWLDTKWSFSFDNYYDPDHVSFGPLRVVNEDVVQPGTGFPMHSHRDMEIVTIVLQGAVQHEDSLGNRAVIRAGEVQRMTAGKGIRHSEANPSTHEPLHLYQIWVHPEQSSLPPSYEQKAFSKEQREGRLLAVVSGRNEEGALHIHQDASFYRAHLQSDQQIVHSLGKDRRAYLQVMEGDVMLNKQCLSTGDAAELSAEDELVITAKDEAEILLIDLP